MDRQSEFSFETISLALSKILSMLIFVLRKLINENKKHIHKYCKGSD